MGRQPSTMRKTNFMLWCPDCKDSHNTYINLRNRTVICENCSKILLMDEAEANTLIKQAATLHERD